MTRKTRIVTLGLAAAIAATGLIALAGDLNPPVGPVAPTHKTLTEVEPRTAINATNTPGDADSLFKITQRGSYYLTGNIFGVIGKHGVEIAASGVTLDLNGFELLGFASLDGVSVTVANQTNIGVVNGSVRNWGDEGIDMNFASNCRVEGVLASGNAGNGISTGTGCTVTNCSAYQNGQTGISAGLGCTVSNCSAYQNGGTGISTTSGCTITNCSAYLNTGSGISTSSGCTISNCSAYFNTGSGISVIIGSSGCTVAECSARANTLDGIVCNSACVIRGNTCSDNGNGGDGAGIHATGAENRIEGNNCTSADRGIDVDLAGNVIIKNSCSGNTIDWVFAANNVFGPIIDRRAPASAAVSGFTAASSLGSTDANANFTY